MVDGRLTQRHSQFIHRPAITVLFYYTKCYSCLTIVYLPQPNLIPQLTILSLPCADVVERKENVNSGIGH